MYRDVIRSHTFEAVVVCECWLMDWRNENGRKRVTERLLEAVPEDGVLQVINKNGCLFYQRHGNGFTDEIGVRYSAEYVAGCLMKLCGNRYVTDRFINVFVRSADEVKMNQGMRQEEH